MVMNAGALGEEIADVISAIDVMSLATGVGTLNRDELDFSYRSWGNQGIDDKQHIVLSVDLQLLSGDRESIKNVVVKIFKSVRKNSPGCKKCRIIFQKSA